MSNMCYAFSPVFEIWFYLYLKCRDADSLYVLTFVESPKVQGSGSGKSEDYVVILNSFRQILFFFRE